MKDIEITKEVRIKYNKDKDNVNVSYKEMVKNNHNNTLKKICRLIINELVFNLLLIILNIKQ